MKYQILLTITIVALCVSIGLSHNTSKITINERKSFQGGWKPGSLLYRSGGFQPSSLSNKLKSGGPGQACQNDTDCWYHACGLITAAPTAPYLCCPSGATVYFRSIEYCTGMAPGDECWINAMCGSYNCSGCNYGKQIGTCT